MPRPGRLNLPNTVTVHAENVTVECSRCGFKGPIANKCDLSQMNTMRYAYQKMHGEGQCEKKEE